MYEITGERVVDVDGTSFVEPFFTSIGVVGIDTDPIGEPLAERSTSAKANQDVLVTASISGWNQYQQLNTFIPSKYAETPLNLQPCIEAWVGEGGVGYYGGDNRTYAGQVENRPSSRTGLEIVRHFDIAGQHDATNRAIWTSGTTLYNGDGTIFAQKNADLSNIVRVGDRGDNTGTMERWSHSVSDPLCAIAPTIDYEVSISGYSNGQVRLYGDHDQAPSYEWRLKITGGVWGNYYTFANKGLQYLVLGAPQAHVDVSGRIAPS